MAVLRVAVAGISSNLPGPAASLDGNDRDSLEKRGAFDGRVFLCLLTIRGAIAHQPPEDLIMPRRSKSTNYPYEPEEFPLLRTSPSRDEIEAARLWESTKIHGHRLYWFPELVRDEPPPEDRQTSRRR
jgi:hypothetical protein